VESPPLAGSAWWKLLLREQLDSGFPDFAGTDATIVLPVSDRLATTLVASRIPPSLPVRNLQLVAEADNRFAVRVQLTKPVPMPVTLRFSIVEQPHLPDSPALVCAVVSEGVGIFMGPLIRLFATLPSWVRFNDNRFYVDLLRLAQQHGLSDFLRYLSELRVTTVPGRFVVSMRGAVVSRGRDPVV